MYGFPGDLDPMVFVVRMLESITFSENTVHLHLSGACTITVDQGVPVRLGERGARTKSREESAPMRESRLMVAIGSTVESAGVEDQSTLVIRFSGGSSIAIVENSERFECYHVQIGDREWHV